MTDKEIIEIDGINVLECEHYQYKSLKDCEMRYPESGDCEIGLINYLFNGNLDMEKLCVDNPNCYFKQLARKTQECEELKAYAQRQENQREEYYKEFLKKDKALEEIENICVQDRDIKDVCLVSTCFESHRVMYDIQEEILNIINKAKGSNNDR